METSHHGSLRCEPPVWRGFTMNKLVFPGLSGFKPWIRAFCELVVSDARCAGRVEILKSRFRCLIA